MTRSRIAPAAASLLLAWAVLLAPGAGAQTPSPSASGSAGSPSASASSPSTEPARESLALLLSAEPVTIEVGGETLLVAQLTNTGNVAVDAGLAVEIPPALELLEAFPAPKSSSGATHTFDLGPVGPGESVVAQLTARGTDVVAEALVEATATGGSASATDSVGVSVVVTGGAAGLAVSSRAERVLAQVGSMVRYVVTVTNEGSEDLEDVLVVDLAPEEIEVVSVDIVDEVEAVQIGESLGRYDIVWNVGALSAGASIELPWDGRAVRPGDLTAVNSVRGLLGQTETVRSSSHSFLATEGRRDVDNPRFEPIEERVVTFVDPPATPAPRGATEAQPGTTLPFTGVETSRLVLSALLLVIAGVLVLGGARLVPEGSGKAVAGAVLAALVLAACVAGDDAATPRTFGTDDPRADGDARVKGERIVRGDEDATPRPTAAPTSTPRPTAPPTPTTTPAPPPSTATPPPVVAAPATPPVVDDPEPIRVVEIVRTELEDLPVETLDSRAGDNTISFAWDETAGITGASSGTRFVRGSGSELFTDLTESDGSIVNEMTLRNANDMARLEVQGRLVHEVFSGGRLVARLRSNPIDVVLSPGGSVSARFSYLLPTGGYVVQATFEASQ
ncbi:MAG TPA: hypothetical protein VHI71_04565 [Actinomycetota bacterium]|nr:hypothetical protein [Actinomycetota bacterium]